MGSVLIETGSAVLEGVIDILGVVLQGLGALLGSAE